MRLINGQGIHNNKNGSTNQGTRFFSAKRTCTAAESNNSNFYPLITFTLPTAEFPDFVFMVEYNWTIHKNYDNNNGQDYRATWVGGLRQRGNMYWNSSTDRGWAEGGGGWARWWYGNYLGDVSFSTISASSGTVGIQMKSALAVSSVLTCQAEVFTTRWDLITSITYTTS